MIKTFCRVAYAVVALTASAQAQQINIPPRSLSAFVVGMGSAGGGSGFDMGQTFTVPTGFNRLDQFSLWFGDVGANGGALTFRTYISEFNTSNMSAGAILFQSAVLAGTATNLMTQYVENTGGIVVVAGTKYLAFADASNFISAGGGRAFMGSEYVDFATPYAGGELCGVGTNGTLASVQGKTWGCGKGDIGITATFSNVEGPVVTPEPASLALLGTGLMGVSAAVRRKRSRPA